MGLFKSYLSLPLLLTVMAPGMSAQNTMACHAMEMRAETPPEKLPVPRTLTGIGNAHIHITAKPEAQVWFDQGLNLLHDFWDYEAMRAFEQGVRIDPQCAMCYWGLAQAQEFSHSNSNYYAALSLNQAAALKGHAGRSERLYIEAAVAEAAEKSEGADRTKSEAVRLYRKLVKREPRDRQASIYLANALNDGYDDADQPRAGLKEALAILQSVMRQDPNDSAANHYWIHAVEASPHPEQALHSAEILGRLAPTSGHMVHMPGHIFYRTGDYAKAKASFAASTLADEQYLQSQQVEVDDDWNYVHNLMYSIANLLEAGEFRQALTLSAKLKDARGQLANTLYIGSPRDSISRLQLRLPVALRSGDWAGVLDLLQSAVPPASQPNLQFLARQLRQFASGMQSLEQHQGERAEATSQQFDAELWRISDRVKDEAEAEAKAEKKTKNDTASPKIPLMPDAKADPLVSTLSIMSLELRAGVLVEKHQGGEAKQLYAQAAREEKALGYREPPAYIRPVGETEAAAFLGASDWADAKAAYQDALRARPRSGFPLFGIAAASERAGDAIAAAREYAEFLAAWQSADSDLPQLAHARAFVAAHPSVTPGN